MATVDSIGVNEALVERIGAFDDLLAVLRKSAAGGCAYSVSDIDCQLTALVGDDTAWLTTILAIAIQRLVLGCG